jgi:hypothetical protein
VCGTHAITAIIADIWDIVVCGTHALTTILQRMSDGLVSYPRPTLPYCQLSGTQLRVRYRANTALTPVVRNTVLFGIPCQHYNTIIMYLTDTVMSVPRQHYHHHVYHGYWAVCYPVATLSSFQMSGVQGCQLSRVNTTIL